MKAPEENIKLGQEEDAKNKEYKDGSGNDDDDEEDDEDEEEEVEDDEEPKLKYQRIGNSFQYILHEDAASCMAVHPKVCCFRNTKI